MKEERQARYKSKENSYSARAKKIGRNEFLADEVEVYRNFGGCLPIERARL